MIDKLVIGSLLATVEKQISFGTMRRYSGEVGIHSQEGTAQDSGLGGALVQGGQLAGYLNQMMVNNFGGGYLWGGEISISFIKPVRPGDVITMKGIVKELQPEGGKFRAKCEVWVENQSGEKTTAGTASALVSD